jgi:hypothetical protein
VKHGFILADKAFPRLKYIPIEKYLHTCKNSSRRRILARAF